MSAQQKKHPFDFKTQYGLGFSTQDDEIVVDFFCGGGGAGTGLEIGLGRAVSVAKNHSPQAISMHTVNHPGAVHFTTDVFEGDPDTECGGKAVGPAYSGKPVAFDQPVGTQMTHNHRAIASACIVQAGHGEGSGESKRRSHGVNDICGPLGTVTASGGGQSIATVFMAQMNGGFNTTAAKSITDPMTTVTNTGSQQQLVTANLVHLRGNCDARDLNAPLHTVSAGGNHHGLMTAFLERQFGASVGQDLNEPAPTITAGGGGKSSLVELQLSPEVEAGALRVAAFLISYYGTENVSAANEPAPTIATRDRLALVTVTIKGTPYVIVDICLRMLQPAELYNAQGFPSDYIISHGADGKPFTKTQQVHMCGNSVSPPPMAALAKANNPWHITGRLTIAA